MNCPQCSQITEPSAAFCGNCGWRLQSVPISLEATLPAYAIAVPAQHAGEIKALLSLLFGVIGIFGGLLMAIVGLVLGIAGLALATMSRSSTKRSMSTAGLILSSLAILLSLAVWSYNIKRDSELSAKTNNPNSASLVLSADLSTPCYSLGFIDKLNINNTSDSCDMKAFNNTVFDNSTEVYKIYASKSSVANAGIFTTTAKAAIEKDIKENLPGFSIANQRVGAFAGSPAYIVTAYDKTNDISMVEAAVLHKVTSGENVFILVHGTNGNIIDLSTLEAEWQWK